MHPVTLTISGPLSEYLEDVADNLAESTMRPGGATRPDLLAVYGQIIAAAQAARRHEHGCDEL